MKKFAVLCLFLAVSAFAANESLCEELCEPCRGSKKTSCEKVESVCGCTALFEKLNRERAARAAKNEKRKTAVERVLYESCKTGSCSVGFLFDGEKIKKLKDGGPRRAFPEPVVKPLASECVELCGTLPAGAGPKDAVYSQIDNTCGCRAFAADSLKLAEFKITRLVGAKKSAGAVVDFCGDKDVCRVQVNMNPETFEPVSVTEPRTKE